MNMKNDAAHGGPRTLTGSPLSPGIAVDDAFVLKPINLAVLESTPFPIDDVEKEIERLDRTIQTTRAQIAEISRRLKHDDNAAGIFDVQNSFLTDTGFFHEIRSDIHSRKFNIEYLISNRIKSFEEKFLSIEDELVKTRILDIQDVYHRMLRNLLDIEHVRSNPLKRVASSVVLVAKQLLPSDIALLEHGKLSGIILEEGNPLSHASIMIKSLNIPSIILVPGICSSAQTGRPLILDSTKGRVVLNPRPADLARFRAAKKRLESIRHIRVAHQPLACRTTDGTVMTIEANASSVKEAEEAVACNAEGIGLLRSEFFYMSHSSLPTVEEEHTFYSKIISVMKKRPVTIRLLDIGADKTLPFLAPCHEENPQLGVRGIRYLLKYPGLFESHLRAVVRTARSASVRLLIPFVTLESDVLKTRELLRRLCREEICDPGNIKVGIMVEIPAVALYPHRFFPLIDFINIGTNDLIQYVFAADRAESAVERYRQSGNPAIYRILASCIAAAGKYRKEVTLCGEIVADPHFTRLLIGLGAVRFSMPPGAIPQVRDAINHSSIETLRLQAQAASSEPGQEN